MRWKCYVFLALTSRYKYACIYNYAECYICCGARLRGDKMVSQNIKYHSIPVVVANVAFNFPLLSLPSDQRSYFLMNTFRGNMKLYIECTAFQTLCRSFQLFILRRLTLISSPLVPVRWEATHYGTIHFTLGTRRHITNDTIKHRFEAV